MGRTLFLHAEELITNRGVADKGGVRVTETDLGIIHDGALVWDSRKGILWLGETRAIPRKLATDAKRVDLKGKVLSPALVDCHTHLVFAGSRHHELALRLAGASYQEIAARGGGIASSVAATRAATPAELYRLARGRVKTIAGLGVGILEIKSGYGLDWPTELKMLKVIAKLKREFAGKIVIQSTFLGAHSFPTGRDHNEYVDEIVDRMIPEVARLKLADACDVFFDQGYYDRSQSERILRAAARHGLKLKLHADELADTGGASLATELGALSADHLLKVNGDGIAALARTGVVAVLLPSTALYLGVEYAPARRLIEAGACVAVSTDYNPGSSPSLHLPFAMSLACFGMGLTMPEAFAGATFGGARALDLHREHGSLAVGMRPKMAVFACASYQALISQLAHPSLCELVI